MGLMPDLLEILREDIVIAHDERHDLQRTDAFDDA